jgi:hypothetical protein
MQHVNLRIVREQSLLARFNPSGGRLQPLQVEMDGLGQVASPSLFRLANILSHNV